VWHQKVVKHFAEDLQQSASQLSDATPL